MAIRGTSVHNTGSLLTNGHQTHFHEPIYGWMDG